MIIKPKYQKNFTFKLKDLAHTRAKYSTYHPRGEQYEPLTHSILDCDVWDITARSQGLKSMYLNYTDKDIKPLSLANHIRTYINSCTYTYHVDSYKDLNFTPSQANSLAIRFYIKNYKAINKKIQEMMIEFMNSTCYAREYFID